MTSQVLCFQHH